MIRNSLLLGSLLSVLERVGRWYEKSFLCRAFSAVSATLSRSFDASVIVSWFRADWDARTRVARLGRPVLRGVERVQRCCAGDGAFAQRLRASVVLRLLDERCIMLVLCAVGFAVPFVPTLLLLLGVLAAFVLWLLNVLLGRIRAGEMGLVGLFGLLFALCYALSALTSPACPDSLEDMLMLLGLMTVMPVAGSVLRTERRQNIFLTVLLCSAVIVSLHGIYQYVTGVAIDPAWVDSKSFADLTSRAYSTFGNPNVMGEYLIVTCSWSVGMLWKAKKPVWKLFYLAAAGTMGLALLATGSRGSMLGLAVSALVFVLFAEHRLIPLAVLAAAAMPFLLPESIKARFLGAIAGTDSSTQYRMSIYGACFAMAKDYWLTGIGVGAFALIYPRYVYAASNAYHSHNLFLQVFLELGIFGFAALMLLLIAWCQRLYRSIAGDKTRRRFLTGVCLSGMVGLLVQGLTDHLWFNYRIVFLFFLTLGVGLACTRRENG